MKHIKSYQEFLLEAEDKAKEIEAKINKMGEVSDDEAELDKDMKASSEGPTTPGEGKKSEKDNTVKGEKLEDGAPKDELAEGAKNEDHEEMDDKIASMSVSDMLGVLQDKDPKAYADMEEYIKKNFSKAAEEGNFFTTMTA